MLGGNIDAVLSTTPFALPFVGNGRMKVLAVTGATRVKELPDTPTFAELGYPSITYRTFFGLAVPKGTPAAVIQKIVSGVRDAPPSPMCKSCSARVASRWSRASRRPSRRCSSSAAATRSA